MGQCLDKDGIQTTGVPSGKRKNTKNIRKDILLDASPSKKRKTTDCNDLKFHFKLDIKTEGTIKRIGMEDFKIHKVIGRGSYGKVYLVEKMMEQ